MNGAANSLAGKERDAEQNLALNGATRHDEQVHNRRSVRHTIMFLFATECLCGRD